MIRVAAELGVLVLLFVALYAATLMAYAVMG